MNYTEAITASFWLQQQTHLPIHKAGQNPYMWLGSFKVEGILLPSLLPNVILCYLSS